MMLITSNPKVMKQFAIRGMLRAVGWLATVVMAAAALMMCLSSFLDTGG